MAIYEQIEDDISLALEDFHGAKPTPEEVQHLLAELEDHFVLAWANGRRNGHLDCRPGVDTRRNPYRRNEA